MRGTDEIDRDYLSQLLDDAAPSVDSTPQADAHAPELVAATRRRAFGHGVPRTTASQMGRSASRHPPSAVATSGRAASCGWR